MSRDRASRGYPRVVRIVSLLPSATEIVCELGLGDRLVGVTHECDFPEFVRDLPKVTHTHIPVDASSAEIDRMVRERMRGGADERQALYSLDMPALEALAPDLIVTQALCDVCAVAEREVNTAACSLPGAPRVLNLEPETLEEVFESMRAVARVADGIEGTTARSAAGEEAVARLKRRVDAVVARCRERSAAVRTPPRVALLEWLDPPFSCGHWNPELVRLAGGVEVLGRAGERSRTVTWADVAAAAPEVVVIACCGFTEERTRQDLPLLECIPEWKSLPAVQADRVFIVDGSAYFSRPGPRLVDSVEILSRAIDSTTCGR